MYVYTPTDERTRVTEIVREIERAARARDGANDEGDIHLAATIETRRVALLRLLTGRGVVS